MLFGYRLFSDRLLAAHSLGLIFGPLEEKCAVASSNQNDPRHGDI
jgi:hypothetical protein